MRLHSLSLTCVVGASVSALLLGAVPVSAADGRPAGLPDVGFDQKLNEPIPLELPFRDETGRTIRLGDYFNKAPVVLTLNYYDCPMLCPLELDDLLRAV